MKKPKLVVKRKLVDYVVEFLTFLAVITSFALPLIYYQDMPEDIPMHFSTSGAADRLGPRNSIWILPVLGAVLCWGIHRLIKFPHLFNYPHRITAQNAAENYRMAQRSLRFINFIVAASIAYITYKIILTSLGRSEGLSTQFLIVFSIIMLGTPLFFMLKMRWHKNKRKR